MRQSRESNAIKSKSKDAISSAKHKEKTKSKSRNKNKTKAKSKSTAEAINDANTFRMDSDDWWMKESSPIELEIIRDCIIINGDINSLCDALLPSDDSTLELHATKA